MDLACFETQVMHKQIIANVQEKFNFVQKSFNFVQDIWDIRSRTSQDMDGALHTDFANF